MKRRHVLTVVFVSASLVSAVETAFGQNWTLTSAPTNYWSSVTSSADGTKLVAVAGGYFAGAIYISSNSGGTWSLTSAPVTNWSSVASSADGTKVAAAVDGDVVYLSTDSGATWTPAPVPITNWSAIAWSADATKLFAAVGGTFVPFGGKPYGLIYISSDSGATWTAASAPVANWTSISCSTDGTRVLAAAWGGGSGDLYVSFDSGAAWARVPVPTAYLCSAVCSGDGTIWTCGSADPFHMGGAGWPILTSTNFGSSWSTSLSPGPTKPCMASSADGSRWVVATRGTPGNTGAGSIHLSTDSAASWTATDSPSLIWAGVACSADGCKLVAAANGGGIYTLQTTPTPVLHIAGSGGNAVLSWTISSLSFVLQENSTLTPANWTDVQTTPALTFSTLQYQVTLPAPTGNRFYRLKD